MLLEIISKHEHMSSEKRPTKLIRKCNFYCRNQLWELNSVCEVHILGINKNFLYICCWVNRKRWGKKFQIKLGKGKNQHFTQKLYTLNFISLFLMTQFVSQAQLKFSNSWNLLMRILFAEKKNKQNIIPIPYIGNYATFQK